MVSAMPTDEERREVARKLREKYKERMLPGFFEGQDMGIQSCTYLEDLEACLPDGESAFTVLADLIEPATRGGGAMRKVKAWLVSDCGGEWIDAREMPVIAFMDKGMAIECARKRTERRHDDWDPTWIIVSEIEVVGELEF